jgi:hypothetical protein
MAVWHREHRFTKAVRPLACGAFATAGPYSTIRAKGPEYLSIKVLAIVKKAAIIMTLAMEGFFDFL